jgi:hypothetical protein
MSKLSDIKGALEGNPGVVIVYYGEWGLRLGKQYDSTPKHDASFEYVIAPKTPVFCKMDLSEFMENLTKWKPDNIEIFENKCPSGRLTFREKIGEDVRKAVLTVDDVGIEGKTEERRDLIREICLEVYPCTEIAISPSSTLPKSEYPQLYKGDIQVGMVEDSRPFYCNNPCGAMAECPYISKEQKKGEEIEAQIPAVYLEEFIGGKLKRPHIPPEPHD